MWKNKLNKLWNLIEKIWNDINLSIISWFLDWFYEKLEINFLWRVEKNLIPKKWDIYLVNLWINIWSELNKNRPWVIISDSKYNWWNNLLVLPFKTYKWTFNNRILHILVEPDNKNNLSEKSYISVISIRDVSKKRFWTKIWALDLKQIIEIDNILTKILNIKTSLLIK